MNEHRVGTSAGALVGAQSRGVSRFLGVPFVASSARAGRFSAPAELPPWRGARSALRPGRSTPQKLPGFPLSSKWFGLAAEPPGEDCLTLNLRTPACDHAKRPVLVFLHGGGFVFGNLGRGPMALSLGLSPGARHLSRRMGRSWPVFARDGHPGEDWPRHSPGDPGVFVLGGMTGWSRRADVPALRYQAEVASRTAMGE